MSKIETYSIPQFFQMQRDKELLRNLGITEEEAFKIWYNRKLKALATFSIAQVLSCQKALALAPSKTTQALGKVDQAGVTLLTIVRKIGYWICIIMAIVEILRCLSNGDTKEIGKIVVKYLMAFAACYLIPWLFDLIAAIFS